MTFGRKLVFLPTTPSLLGGSAEVKSGEHCNHPLRVTPSSAKMSLALKELQLVAIDSNSTTTSEDAPQVKQSIGTQLPMKSPIDTLTKVCCKVLRHEEL